MAWAVEIDAAEFLTATDQEREIAEGEMRKFGILAWESATKATTSIYGGDGEDPPPMLAELERRSKATRR
jgi:hypothetical protein